MDTLTLLGITLVALVCVALSFVLGYALYIVWIRSKYAHIPGPPCDEFFLAHGSLYKNEMDAGNPATNAFISLFEKYGTTIKFFVFHIPTVVTIDPASIQSVLVHGDYPKPGIVYEKLQYVWGYRFAGPNGMVATTSHDQWYKLRRAVQGPLHRLSLKSHFQAMNEGMTKSLKKLKVLADQGNYINIHHETRRMLLEIFGKIAFSTGFNSILDKECRITHAIDVVNKGMHDSIMNVRQSKEMMKKIKQESEFSRDFAREVLEKRRELLKTGQNVSEDLLTCILNITDIDSSLGTEDMLDLILTFIVGGQETPANGLAFTFLELGRRPDITKKLQQEVDTIIGDKSSITYEDLGKLEYVNMVYKETLRYYAPGVGTVRRTTKKQQIGGYDVPIGSDILVPFRVLQRSKRFWDKPEEFIPERFSKDGLEKIHKHTYIPYSIGPRSCFGQAFADFVFRLILARFVQHFDFDIHPDQDYSIDEMVTSHPKNGLRCKLRKRAVSA